MQVDKQLNELPEALVCVYRRSSVTNAYRCKERIKPGGVTAGQLVKSLVDKIQAGRT